MDNMDDSMDLDVDRRQEEHRLRTEMENQESFVSFGTAHFRIGVPTREKQKVIEEWDALVEDEDREYVIQEMNHLRDLRQQLNDAQSTVNRRKVVWTSLRSNYGDRLRHLDPYDDAMSNAIATCNVYRQALRDLREWYNGARGSVFQASINWRLNHWRGMRSTWYNEQTEFRKETLYPSKRNAPGRKQEAPRIPGEDFDRYRDRLEDRASFLPTLPPSRFLSGDLAAVRWTCVNKVGGKGGQNLSVEILIGVDNNDRMLERKVRKNISMEGNWRVPQHWHGDLEDDGDLYPREYLAQRLMSRDEARFVVKALGNPIYDNDNEIVQIYMEYAMHSDLEEAMLLHARENTQIPEGFLWMLFHALVETVYIMKYGSLESSTAPEDWHEVVHRDLKPPNILLDQRNSGHFSMYPRPKVADYGLSLLTSDTDPCNPYIYTSGGTPGYIPPEIKRFIDPQTEKRVDDHNKILSPCNIWGIGAILYALMTLKFLDGLPPPEHQLPYCISDPPHVPLPGESGAIFEHDVAAGVVARWGEGRYNDELAALVQTCLRFEPEERAKVETLRAWLEEMMRFGDSRKLYTGVPIGFEMQPLLFEGEKMEYRNGLVCPPAWRAPTR